MPPNVGLTGTVQLYRAAQFERWARHAYGVLRELSKIAKPLLGGQPEMQS